MLARKLALSQQFLFKSWQTEGWRCPVKPTNNLISVICIVSAVMLTVFIFSESRNDSGLRMAALVSSTGIATALVAIASTLLTGKDLTQKDPPAIPPGSTSIQQETTTSVTTPPDTIQK
jgi:hypothetical protein